MRAHTRATLHGIATSVAILPHILSGLPEFAEG